MARASPQSGGSVVTNGNLLYATATGDPGDVGYFPTNAVRWLTPSRDIAAPVCDASTDRFRAELFHFGTKPRATGAELHLLAPGSYTMTLMPNERRVAYLSMEIGLDPGIPTYSGGLGVLSAEDAASLYEKLEETVVPLFYRDRDRWVGVMRHCVALNGSFFNTQRMIQQYVVKAYFE